MFIQKKSKRVVKANDEMLDNAVDVQDDIEEVGEVEIDPAATDLLFEAEDVAELIAEVTGETVEVSVEDDFVEFAIGEDVYTIEAEGDEEILEAASSKVLRGKRRVAASTRRPAARKPVAASTKVVRRMPAKGRR